MSKVNTQTSNPADPLTFDPQALARACADEMWSSDNASQYLGMDLVSVKPGSAVMTMTIAAKMTNGFGICHGGYVFMLADSTFAFSCNTYNQMTVAQGCTIDYLRPCHTGDVLRATGVEIKRGRVTGLYDINVVNQNDQAVATFRGRAFILDKPVLKSNP